MTLLLLLAEFFKAGLFAIGGGLATLPFLMEMSQTHPTWFTLDELMNMVAISESTPGPLGVNMASYVGFHVAGISGAVIATLGLVLPSYIIILIVVRVLDRFQNHPRVIGGLQGLHPAVTGLIAVAGYSVITASLLRTTDGVTRFQWLAFILLLVFLTAMQLKPLERIHPVLYIVFGAVLGVLLQL